MVVLLGLFAWVLAFLRVRYCCCSEVAIAEVKIRAIKTINSFEDWKRGFVISEKNSLGIEQGLK